MNYQVPLAGTTKFNTMSHTNRKRYSVVYVGQSSKTTGPLIPQVQADSDKQRQLLEVRTRYQVQLLHIDMSVSTPRLGAPLRYPLFCFVLAHPFNYHRTFSLFCPCLDLTQIRGHLAGFPPSPPHYIVRYAPSFVSRQDSSPYFPRRLASNCAATKMRLMTFFYFGRSENTEKTLRLLTMRRRLTLRTHNFFIITRKAPTRSLA